MHDTTDNALVEISLALAMAFFALLVVALVSIAAPAQPDNDTIERSRAAVEKLGLTPEFRDGPSTEETAPRILLHYRDGWFDIGGDAVNPARLTADEHRLVVALAPDLTLAEAREAQKAVLHLDAAPTLTTLSPDWLERLATHR